ncbi:ATP synthase F1 subunit gamma [bacterium]|nr:ATP synthase F1 subunit gamma [bacterium]
MAEKKQIKERIQATNKTYQITSAMNMVSTSKLKRSEKSLKTFRPISDEIIRIMTSLLASNDELTHKALLSSSSKPCYIIIASDRGLIGNYNNALFKFFEAYIASHHKSNDDFMVATIGFKAYMYAKKKKYNIVNQESVNNRDDILFTDFEDVSNSILKMYLNDEIGKTTVFYSVFINTLNSKIVREHLLPIHIRERDKNNIDSINYTYEPGKESVLDSMINLYINYSLYRIMLEAKTSEHAARMNAMKNAKDNAKEIEEKLTLLYNHARQNQITTELIDIINGSNAV